MIDDSTRTRLLRGLREATLWIGAVLGVLCLAWSLTMAALGLTPLVFTSGSMGPHIETGSLAFARTVPAEDLRVGDVVSVTDSRGTRVTHRVVGGEVSGESAMLTLKGDANAAPDAERYQVRTADRVAFALPRVGYLISAVGSPWGMFTGGLLVAGVLFLAFGGRDRTGDRASSGGRQALGVGVGLVAVGALMAGGTGTVEPTRAAFSDRAIMTTGSLSGADSSSSADCVATLHGTKHLCEISGIRARQWSDGITTYRDYYISLSSAAGYGAIPSFTVDLSRLKPADLTITAGTWPARWTTMGTIATGQYTTSHGYACSGLPVITASSPAWTLNQTLWIRVVAQRGAVDASSLTCS